MLESTWFKVLGLDVIKENIDNNVSISHFLNGHQQMNIAFFLFLKSLQTYTFIPSKFLLSHPIII